MSIYEAKQYEVVRDISQSSKCISIFLFPGFSWPGLKHLVLSLKKNYTLLDSILKLLCSFVNLLLFSFVRKRLLKQQGNHTEILMKIIKNYMKIFYFEQTFIYISNYNLCFDQFFKDQKRKHQLIWPWLLGPQILTYLHPDLTLHRQLDPIVWCYHGNANQGNDQSTLTHLRGCGLFFVDVWVFYL